MELIRKSPDTVLLKEENRKLRLECPETYGLQLSRKLRAIESKKGSMAYGLELAHMLYSYLPDPPTMGAAAKQMRTLIDFACADMPKATAKTLKELLKDWLFEGYWQGVSDTPL